MDQLNIKFVDLYLIVEKIHTFYENAWTKLIIVITILISFVGVVIPLVSQWYQKRTFKLEEKEIKEGLLKHKLDLEKEIKNSIELALVDLEQKLTKYIDSKMEKVTERIDASRGALFHLQGMNRIEKDLEGAMVDFITAAEAYTKGKDEYNLSAALNLIEKTLLKFNKNNFNNKIEKRLESYLAELSKYSSNGSYIRQIEKIQENLKSAINKLPQ